MESSAHFPHCWRFGLFEVLERSGELRRDGIPVHLREQSSRILVSLLAHPGEIVTREDLRQLLWSSDTFVDFEHSVNTAIMKLREALGDSAERPLYIETLPKRGYRFIAPVAEGAEQEKARAGAQGPADGVGNQDGEEPGHRLQGGAVPHPQGDTAPRLAVLPFVDVSERSGEHYGHGLASQLIVRLEQAYKRVHVIWPVSSLHFAGSLRSVSEIAGELGADYLLMGSVWRVPPQLRISAQLMRATDQCCVWSDSYTREETSVFEVQDEIIRNIAAALLQTLPEPTTAVDRLTATPSVFGDL